MKRCCYLPHSFHRLRIIEQDPFDDRERQTAVLDQIIVELAETKFAPALSRYVPSKFMICHLPTM